MRAFPAFILAFILVVLACPTNAEDVVATNIKLYTGPDSGDARAVVIRMTDGVISGISSESEDGDTVLLSGSGGYVTPGFIDSGSTLGIEEVGLSTKAEDQKYKGDEMSAGFDPLLAFNVNSSLIPSFLSEGVTHMQIRPEAGIDVFAGLGGIVSLTEGPLRNDRGAVYVYLGETGRDRAGASRAAALQRLLTGLSQAQLYIDKRKAFEANRLRQLSFSEADLEVLGSVLKGERKLVVYVDRAAEITSVLTALDTYNLDVVLAGAREAWKVIDAIGARKVPVILNVMDNRPSSFDRLGVRLDQAKLLSEAGILIAFMSEYIYQESRMLSQSAGTAVAYGMPWQEALDAITINPARIWGVDNILGSLEVGKEATFVVWNGDPFELTSHATHIVVKGELIEMNNRQDLLRERYRTLIDQNNLPYSYR